MRESDAFIGIGREKLSRRARLKWWMIFQVRWLVGRGSRDGRVRYVR